MKKILKLACAFLLTFGGFAYGSTLSPRSTHPLAFMHGLPSGESPGWKNKKWFHSELQYGNYWNAPSSFEDKRTGDFYTYRTDFEQALLYLESGFALNKELAVSVGLPIVYRYGGFMDQALDDWHIFVGADRFRRPYFQKNKSRWSIERNGIEQLTSPTSNGLGNALLKMKYWFYQIHDPEGEPAYKESLGASISTQIALPLRGASSGLSTGNTELSALLHFGSHVAGKLYFWGSASLTKKAPSPLMTDWPQKTWAQMYEACFEYKLKENWTLIAQLRYESPLMEASYLNFIYHSTEDKYQDAERAASGWNGLTSWRATESLGFRYRVAENKTFTFLFQEDFTLGDNDGRGNIFYVHGTPDVALIGQFQVQY